MRRFALVLLVLLVVLSGAFVWARFFADGPVAQLPGGRLSGTLIEPPPDGFAFTNDYDYVTVEHLGDGLPYSTTVWFMTFDDRVHLILPSLFGRGLHDRLLETPRVRVRFGDRLYDQRAVLLDATSQEAFDGIMPPMMRRQFGIEIKGEVRPLPGQGTAESWVWRLEDL